MSGPVAQAVTTAIKAQAAADADGTPAAFDSYWHVFLPTWCYQRSDNHLQARWRDEQVKGRAP